LLAYIEATPVLFERLMLLPIVHIPVTWILALLLKVVDIILAPEKSPVTCRLPELLRVEDEIFATEILPATCKLPLLL